MGYLKPYSKALTALLAAGSALLLSCAGNKGTEELNPETLITQKSDTLLIINTDNGRKTYRFSTPMMEYYEYAKEPYMEFRRGIDIETYKDDSDTVESTLVADYAIHWIDRDLWEAKGNVVAVNAEGQILETQQLFWNRKTGRIYSNVDTRFTQGTDVIIGIGFESDENFQDFIIRRPRGKVAMDVEPTKDSTATASPAPDPTAGDKAVPVPAKPEPNSIQSPPVRKSPTGERKMAKPRNMDDLKLMPMERVEDRKDGDPAKDRTQ